MDEPLNWMGHSPNLQNKIQFEFFEKGIQIYDVL